MILSVSLNGEKPSDLFAWRAADGQLLLRLADLVALGLRVPPSARLITHSGEAHLQVNALEGVEARFDAASSALALTAEPRLLTRVTVIDSRRSGLIAPPQRNNSAFLNWALERNDGPSGLGLPLTLEGGARIGAALVQSSASNANANINADGSRSRRGLTRLMSSATWDDPAQARQWIAGDQWAGATELTPGANIGGIGLRSATDDPSRPRYAMGSVQGQARLPSQVEVYVDGQRVRTERVRPGEFDIRDLTAQPGARSVEVLVRDPYGRVQRIEASLYVADELLRAGLHDFYYAAGVLRQDYGVASNAYGAPAYALDHRWGATDGLTLAAQAQGRRGLANMGGSAGIAIGSGGVLTFGGAASQSESGAGHLGLLRYSFQSGDWSVGAGVRRQSARYMTLTDRAGPVAEHSAMSLQASMRLGAGSLGVHHARRQIDLASSDTTNPSASGRSAIRSSGLGYSRYEPSWRAFLRATLTHLADSAGSRREFAVNASFYFGNGQSLATSARAEGASRVQSVGWSVPAPAFGWGHELTIDHSHGAGGASQQIRGATQINASRGVLRAEVYAVGGGAQAHQNLRLTAAGGLVWLNGKIHVGQPVHDAFAVVQVGDLQGVPVLVNGEPKGKTDAAGQLFVANLPSLYGVDFSIDATATPIDYRLTHLRQRVVLARRSGATVSFDAVRVQAVVGRLIRTGGGELPPLTPIIVTMATSKLHSITGLDGALYLENLAAGRHRASAELEQGACVFWLDIPQVSDALLDLGEIGCESR